MSSGSAPTTTATGAGSGDGGDAGLVEGEDEPIEADPEPDARRRPPAEQLDQAVVAAPAADRLLLALAPGDVELERGPGVVVEAADQPRLEPVADARARRGARGRAAKCSAQASHRRSVIFGAAALSAAIAGSFESSRRRTLRSSRVRSSSGSASRAAR